MEAHERLKTVSVEISDSEKEYYKKWYNQDVDATIDRIYDDMMRDDLFVAQVKEPSNDIEDVYLQFAEKAEAIVLQSIDTDLGINGRVVWNVLVGRGDVFFNEWTHEMFDILRRDILDGKTV